MIIRLKNSAGLEQVQNFMRWLEAQGLRPYLSVSEDAYATLGLIGDTTVVDRELIRAMEIVADVEEIKEPYKSANRKFHPADSVITVKEKKIGGGHFAVIAGPCSVESEEQIICVAEQVKRSGATMLRGGAFKPRTSPYAFQGMRAEGIQLLLRAKEKTGLPIVTEIMDSEQLPLFEHVDVIQVGARNMQNFELLKKLGRIKKPILLKRGLSATIEELLMSAEYIMAGGNKQVILCERGIRTFETYTRNTLDILAVAVLKKISHLPVVVDPSHSTGRSDMVPQMSLASAAAGADGLIIEVHNDPKNALCDGPQSLTPEQFDDLQKRIVQIRSVIGAEV